MWLSMIIFVCACFCHLLVANLSPLLSELFEKLAKYANGEIEASSEEYALLEKLNLHAAGKYASLADHAERLVSAFQTLSATHQSLQPFLQQIDQLEQNLSELESVVAQLDLYSKRLHYTFQQVYK